MDRHIANFCDDKMLWFEMEFTDEVGNVLLDKLAEAFKAYWFSGCEWNEWTNEPIDQVHLLAYCRREVQNWWHRYPLAFKYNNYEYA